MHNIHHMQDVIHHILYYSLYHTILYYDISYATLTANIVPSLSRPFRLSSLPSLPSLPYPPSPFSFLPPPFHSLPLSLPSPLPSLPPPYAGLRSRTTRPCVSTPRRCRATRQPACTSPGSPRTGPRAELLLHLSEELRARREEAAQRVRASCE